jgi:hypothetical protein
VKATQVRPLPEISGDLHAFSKANVEKAPEESGVYALYIPGILIYIGIAGQDCATLRSRLESHFSGAEGACTRGASAFRYELTTNPAERGRELLEGYSRGHGGKLPRCNDQAG